MREGSVDGREGGGSWVVGSLPTRKGEEMKRLWSCRVGWEDGVRAVMMMLLSMDVKEIVGLREATQRENQREKGMTTWGRGTRLGINLGLGDFLEDT